MTNNDIILRLVAENFDLKDQLSTALKEKEAEKESSLFWYERCMKAEGEAVGDESPEGMNAKCQMTTD